MSRLETDVPAEEPAKPEIAFDLDGVICRPPLGLNVAIGRRLHHHPVPDEYSLRTEDERRARAILRFAFENLKYSGRQPLADSREGLEAVSEFRTPVLVTARHSAGKKIIQRWLARHGLADFIMAIYANDTTLNPGQHKLRTARERGILEHVDDDGGIAFFLANSGLTRVYLREWLLNRGLPYPENVVRFRRISDIADDLRRLHDEGSG